MNILTSRRKELAYLKTQNRQLKDSIWKEEFEEIKTLFYDFHNYSPDFSADFWKDGPISETEASSPLEKFYLENIDFIKKYSHTNLSMRALRNFQDIADAFQIYHKYIPITIFAWCDAILPVEDGKYKVILSDPFSTIECEPDYLDLSSEIGKLLNLSLLLIHDNNNNTFRYKIANYRHIEDIPYQQS